MTEVIIIEPDPRPQPDDLTQRVQAIAGVAAVFAPRPTAAALPQAVNALVRKGPVGLARIDVVESGTAIRIDARLATERRARTPETVRMIADALLLELGAADGVIDVQVARIV